MAIATRRPAPKAMATRQCLHQCSFRFHFPHSFVEGCECSHCHYASRDTGAPSRSDSCYPSGPPALKSSPAPQACLIIILKKQHLPGFLQGVPMKSVSSFLHSGGAGRWRGGGTGHSTFRKQSGREREHECFLKQNKAKQRGLFQNLKQEKSFSFIPSAR